MATSVWNYFKFDLVAIPITLFMPLVSFYTAWKLKTSSFLILPGVIKETVIWHFFLYHMYSKLRNVPGDKYLFKVAHEGRGYRKRPVAENGLIESISKVTFLEMFFRGKEKNVFLYSNFFWIATNLWNFAVV